MKRDILSEALEIKEELILWRRSLHRIPEVGLILPETFRFVTEQLDRMGITYKTYTGHSGIVADFGNGQGKTVAIRAIWTDFRLRRTQVLNSARKIRICMPAATMPIRQFCCGRKIIKTPRK